MDNELAVCHECGRVCRIRYSEMANTARLPQHKNRGRRRHRGACWGSGQLVEIEARDGQRVGQYEQGFEEVSEWTR